LYLVANAINNKKEGWGGPMSTLMQRIHQDHIHVTHLMDILDEQLSLFHDGKVPDYSLMLDIMHYMMNYPDLVHHVAEEIIFKKLVGVQPQLKEEAKKITEQHLEMAEKASDFSDDLQAIVDGDSILARDQIEQKARYYIELMRNHMQQEEGNLMPAAEQELTKTEMKEIERSMSEITDPMANMQLLQEYEVLYNRITNED
jgi:hemerythrin-like domain-containing protein